MDKLKIAIVQEWLVTVGGSDKVVKAIKDVFPEADIFTLVANKKTCEELGFEYKSIKTSFIQKLPFAKKGKHRMYLPLFPFAIEQFDLSNYNIIISSSHSVAKGIITNNNQLHICYCHSPVRYAWDLYHQYLNESGLNKGIKGLLAKYILHKLRLWDLLSSFRVDYFISNSNYIGKRIKKVYRRDSVTIYPNIDVDKFELCEEKEDYFVTCSRLVPYKKIDLVVSAFKNLPDKKLIVIGDGPELKKIKKIASQNVELKGYLPFNEMKNYIKKAKAFIFAADEDFGMLPVEAQACGTPVIAFGRGGALESVLDHKTGLFFYEQTEDSIVDAILQFEKNSNGFKPKEIRNHAQKFSEKRFKSEISDFIKSRYQIFINNQ